MNEAEGLKVIGELSLAAGQVVGQRDEARRHLKEDRKEDRKETNLLLLEIKRLLVEIERNTRR